MPGVVSALRLADSDFEDVTPKSKKPRIHDRVEWAIAYLKAAGLLESSGRGRARATEAGVQYAESAPDPITPADLLKFEPFRKFYQSDGLRQPKGRATPEREATPVDRIEAAAEELRASIIVEISERLRAASPSTFERVVVDLLLAQGYGGTHENAASLTGRPGDGGIDGVINQDPFGLEKILVQAKRWRDRVGTPEITHFLGAMTSRGVKRGVILTTSSFSDEAARVAERNPELKVVLIDGNELAALMLRAGLGVTKVAEYPVHRIDTDYFES